MIDFPLSFSFSLNRTKLVRLALALQGLLEAVTSVDW